MGKKMRTGIIPDGSTVLRPVHPCKTVMVPRHQTHHVLANHLVLIVVHVVDPRHVQALAGEDALPARDAIRSDDRVRRRKLIAHVER